MSLSTLERVLSIPSLNSVGMYSSSSDCTMWLRRLRYVGVQQSSAFLTHTDESLSVIQQTGTWRLTSSNMKALSPLPFFGWMSPKPRAQQSGKAWYLESWAESSTPTRRAAIIFQELKCIARDPCDNYGRTTHSHSSPKPRALTVRARSFEGAIKYGLKCRCGISSRISNENVDYYCCPLPGHRGCSDVCTTGRRRRRLRQSGLWKTRTIPR